MIQTWKISVEVEFAGRYRVIHLFPDAGNYSVTQVTP